jgi:Fic-DOC domain mobile mystery protein B
MFDAVWRWAGSYRETDTNLGVPWFEIQVAVEELIRDLNAQSAAGGWSVDEIAVRFHHRLVSIHPFPNGNGRHARLAADVIVETLGGVRFEWGARAQLSDAGRARDEYLAALKCADGEGDFAPLLSFARLTGE